jgi:hypothetical protein
MSTPVCYGPSRRSVESLHGAAEQLAAVHEGLGPEAAAFAAAAALLSSPTTIGVLRRVAVGVTAAVLTVADAVQNPTRGAAREVAR